LGEVEGQRRGEGRDRPMGYQARNVRRGSWRRASSQTAPRKVLAASRVPGFFLGVLDLGEAMTEILFLMQDNYIPRQFFSRRRKLN